MIETNGFDAFRRVIDLSADSANNWNGPSIQTGRQAAIAAGITINGLAVLCRGCVSGRAADYDLETAFEERLIGGPGAFVVTADGDAAFADAVRSKADPGNRRHRRHRRDRAAAAAPSGPEADAPVALVEAY